MESSGSGRVACTVAVYQAACVRVHGELRADRASDSV